MYMVYRYQCCGGASCLMYFKLNSYKVKPLCIVPEGTVEKMPNAGK
jgi:hypothetical protein